MPRLCTRAIMHNDVYALSHARTRPFSYIHISNASKTHTYIIFENV